VGTSTFLYGDRLGDVLSVSPYWLVLAHISNDGLVTVSLGQSRRGSGLHADTPISPVEKTLSILLNCKKVNTKYK